MCTCESMHSPIQVWIGRDGTRKHLEDAGRADRVTDTIVVRSRQVIPPDQLAELARKLQQEAPGSPEREAFLERLATEIRSGRYEVDTDALARILADKLISETD